MTTSATAPTDLFAAMNIATGEVLYDTRKRHTANDVLAFFKLIDLHVPARPRRPRRARQPLRPHGAPRSPSGWPIPNEPAGTCTSPRPARSWLNLVERWFKELTDRRLRRGAFTSVDRAHRSHRDLDRALERRPQALHLAQDRRRNHRESPPRTSRTPPDQIRDGPLATARSLRPPLAAGGNLSSGAVGGATQLTFDTRLLYHSIESVPVRSEGADRTRWLGLGHSGSLSTITGKPRHPADGAPVLADLS